ncbi:MAG: hypothetical protein GYA51_09365 [Candidatus Methanofastidiosa archaeon]|nr:hypothetical protein [Candidatus Methanofastidiosa archaeon]
MLLIDGRIVNVFFCRNLLGNIAIYKDEVVGFGDYEADKIIDLNEGTVYRTWFYRFPFSY